MKTKVCVSCGTRKSLDKFHYLPAKPGRYSARYHSWCRLCVSVRRSKKRKVELASRYGLTEKGLIELRKMYKKCGICGFEAKNHWKALNVDHCHKTGEVRGMLCMTCNTALGAFKDDISLLHKAVQYLIGEHATRKKWNKRLEKEKDLLLDDELGD